MQGLPSWIAGALFLLAAGATLGISSQDPRLPLAYDCGAFLLGAIVLLRVRLRLDTRVLSLAAISVWGWVQLGAGATVYRHVTLEAALRWAALGATALTAAWSLKDAHPRERFLRGFAWFGCVVSVAAVLGYYTSPGKILWVFDVPYPDVWGPFLSRNNFAQFLELTLPVALWLALSSRTARNLTRRRPVLPALTGGAAASCALGTSASGGYLTMAAAMLAAGIASASRAGAVILILETVAIFWLRRKAVSKRAIFGFAAAGAGLAAVAGVENLTGRLAAPDPWEDRREIVRSAVQMTAEHPFKGFGLGTFETVYPAYASFDIGAVIEHAHCDWLEWSAEGGLPFAAVWMVLALAIAGSAVRSIWGIGVVGCFLHAFVDYPFARLGITGWTFVLMGALIGRKGVREVHEHFH